MKEFVYTSAHINALKKYGVMKVLFLLLGCLVLLLQSIAWLIVWLKDIEISTSSMVFVTITLVATLYFIASQCFFAIRNIKIIRTINTNGEFRTRRIKFKFSNISSWAGGMVIVTRVIAIIFVILMAILTVNFLQNYLNWGKVILKVPFMMFCTVGFLNLSAELRFQTMVEKINY